MADAQDESTEEMLMVPDGDIGYLREIAIQHEVDLFESEPRGVEPMSTIAVVLLGSAWAINTVSRLLEERKGGQVIDLRAGATRPVHRSRDVQYGLIVVLAADGTVTIRVKDSQDKLNSIIDSLGALVKGNAEASVDAITDVARAQLGVDAEIAKEQK